MKKRKVKTGNKPKTIYFTADMGKDLAQIRKVRTDDRLSDSALIADAMHFYAEHILLDL